MIPSSCEGINPGCERTEPVEAEYAAGLKLAAAKVPRIGSSQARAAAPGDRAQIYLCIPAVVALQHHKRTPHPVQLVLSRVTASAAYRPPREQLASPFRRSARPAAPSIGHDQGAQRLGGLIRTELAGLPGGFQRSPKEELDGAQALVVVILQPGIAASRVWTVSTGNQLLSTAGERGEELAYARKRCLACIAGGDGFGGHACLNADYARPMEREEIIAHLRAIGPAG